MSDDKKIDETLQNMGFSTMSDDEQNELDNKRKPKKPKASRPKGLPESEIVALRERVKTILDELPHPIESDMWMTEVNELQAQLRSCINNEIFDRYIDYDRHKLFKVFMREVDEEDEQLALTFPIALAQVIYNHMYDPDAIPEEEGGKSKKDLLEGTAFEKQSFFDLVEQVIIPDVFFCENVHPYVSKFLDDVDLNKVNSLVSEEQAAVASILAREVLIRVYAESLAFLFKPRIKNGAIMKMLNAVIIITFATNKYVSDEMSDLL